MNQVLRFSARIVDAKPEDVNRRFILSYHLATDQISIYEPPQRNSGIVVLVCIFVFISPIAKHDFFAGIIGGKFLEARKVLHASHDQRVHPRYYGTEDLYIGAILEV